MFFHYVTAHVSMAPPAAPLWFLTTNDALHPVLSLRTKIVHEYKREKSTHVKAPHHSELVKVGWEFVKTEIITESLILRGRELVPIAKEMQGRFFESIPTREIRDTFVRNYATALEEPVKIIRRPESDLVLPPSYNAPWVEELRLQRDKFSRIENIKNLLRVTAYFHTGSLNQMATLIAAEPAWIEKTLGFAKSLIPSAITMVRSGQIPLSNAYALTKLPQVEQPSWLQQAQILPAAEFAPRVNCRAKEIRDAKRQAN
jgi:hypothetical protein